MHPNYRTAALIPVLINYPISTLARRACSIDLYIISLLNAFQPSKRCKKNPKSAEPSCSEMEALRAKCNLTKKK
jgi:hypothetical protein